MAITTESSTEIGPEDPPGEDEYGENPETGQIGTIPADWYADDGEVTWTDNNGGEHTFTVDNDHW